MSVKSLWKTAVKFVDEHLPTILSGIAIVGLGTSVGLAIKETPKAQEAIMAAKVDKAEALETEDNTPRPSEVKLTAWEGFKAIAPVYWPLAMSTIGTGVCIIAADRTHNKRYLAVAAALSLKDKDLAEYKAKVKELFGEKKSDEVQRELAKDYAMNVPQDDGTIILTTNGMDLFYEPITRTYFRSSPIAVERGIRDFYQFYTREHIGSVDDLLDRLDVCLKDNYIASRFEWSDVGDGRGIPEIDIDYSGTCTRTGEVVHVLKYTGDGPRWIGN